MPCPVKNQPYNRERDTALYFKLSTSIFGEGNDNPLQNSCLENPMERGAWRATVHWVSKSQTQLKSQHTYRTWKFHCNSLWGGSICLNLRVMIPGMGSHRVGHDWSDLAVAARHDLHCCLGLVWREGIIDRIVNIFCNIFFFSKKLDPEKNS